MQGVAKVLHADRASLAEQLIAKNYGHLLFPATAHGKNVAQISDITKVDAADTFERPIYAGNAIATVQNSDAIKAVTLRTTGFDPEGTGPGRGRAAVDAGYAPNDWQVGRTARSSRRSSTWPASSAARSSVWPA